MISLDLSDFKDHPTSQCTSDDTTNLFTDESVLERVIKARGGSVIWLEEQGQGKMVKRGEVGEYKKRGRICLLLTENPQR